MSQQLNLLPEDHRLFVDDLPTAPFVVGSKTSRAAAEQIRHELGNLESLVFDCIRAAAARGRTDDEIEVICHLRHQTASARRRGLVLRGMIRDSGVTRLTRSKRKATVWILKSDVVGDLPKGKALERPTRSEMDAALAELRAALIFAPPSASTLEVLHWLRDNYV